MIELIIKDGLGNQMFEYAFARLLQSKYNEEIVINPYYMNTSDFRRLSLDNYKLNNNIRILEEQHQKRHMLQFKIKTMLAFGLDIIPWRIMKRKPIGEFKYIKRAKRGVYYTFTPYTSFKFVYSKAKTKYVFGCFQGEQNFEEIKNIIKGEFEIVTPPSKENTKILNEIENCNAVCLHVRRGDYLDKRWEALQVCNFEYYKKAIQYVKSKIESPIFYIFSTGHNDIEWIKSNYKFDAEIRYVDLDNLDYEEQRLMIKCKHFIISNSTFSWWAAYLSSNSSKIVVAPSVWNRGRPNEKGIYMREWVLIDV